MLDGFSHNNQISIRLERKEKTTFATPWGAFIYNKIPFGLMNVEATFQHAMDIVFVVERGKLIVIYLDDMKILSKTYEEHKTYEVDIYEV